MSTLICYIKFRFDTCKANEDCDESRAVIDWMFASCLCNMPCVGSILLVLTDAADILDWSA